ncbi:MAG: GlsB/YeaQ/YmgE family stress response membrane protein [Candidatus Latescibacterota bacterium]
MSLTGFFLLWIIAAVSGSVAQAITGYSLGGCLVSTAIGFIGAIIGQWLARASGLPLLYTLNIDGEPFPVVWSILGAVIFVLAIGLVTRGQRR